eukprot:gene15766-18017_t
MSNPALTWSSYLAFGVPRTIYHMCDASEFERGTNDGAEYFPPTYAQDGFTHASAYPVDLVACGNNFYKQVKGDWICISLNSALLDGEVKYELAAPVGERNTNDTSGQPKYPHIYGGIPKRAVMKVYKIVRGADGEFLSIAGLTDK